MMQLDTLTIYSHAGETRRIEFRPGELNVITGDSKTGKSSMIGILRFLLGSDSPHVPRGPILRSVIWYGLSAHVGGTRFFIGRPAPAHGTTTTQAFLQVGSTVPPPLEALEPNVNTEELRIFLGGLLGIGDNLNVPAEGQTRNAIAATFVHSLTYCFQGQGEIANPDILFHRQNHEWQPQTIRDTLPYFLGAQGIEDLHKRDELVKTRRSIKRVAQQLDQAVALRDQGVDAIELLWREASRVGLVTGTQPSTTGVAVEALRSALTSVDLSPVGIDPGSDMEEALDARLALRQELRRLNDEIHGLARYATVDDDYTAELEEHRARLATIGLLPEPSTSAVLCPLCMQTVPLPADEISALQQQLEDVHQKLESTARDQPRIQAARETLNARRVEVLAALRDLESTLRAQADEQDSAKASRDLWESRSYVKGKIAQFLQHIPEGDDHDLESLRRSLDELREVERQLAEDLDPEALRSRVASILNVVSRPLQTIARELDLEHSEFGARIDGHRLTIVADTPDGPAYMDQGEIGSGMNWVGYHLAAHLALHEFFIHHARPVPSFLVVDQPSQAFFPRDREEGGELEEMKDDDRENTRRLYELMFHQVQKMAGRMQIIAFDHADFGDPWFQDSIVERWRDGAALVPKSWDPAPLAEV